jgi:hypothetical protein
MDSCSSGSSLGKLQSKVLDSHRTHLNQPLAPHTLNSPRQSSLISDFVAGPHTHQNTPQFNHAQLAGPPPASSGWANQFNPNKPAGQASSGWNEEFKQGPLPPSFRKRDFQPAHQAQQFSNAVSMAHQDNIQDGASTASWDRQFESILALDETSSTLNAKELEAGKKASQAKIDEWTNQFEETWNKSPEGQTDWTSQFEDEDWTADHWPTEVLDLLDLDPITTGIRDLLTFRRCRGV